MGLQGDLDGLGPALETMHAHRMVNEAYKMLQAVQDGLNLKLNG
jgi:hypothetical protein